MQTHFFVLAVINYDDLCRCHRAVLDGVRTHSSGQNGRAGKSPGFRDTAYLEQGIATQLPQITLQPAGVRGNGKITLHGELLRWFRHHHQLAGNNVELIATRTGVKPRLAEIRPPAMNECKDLSPVVTTTTQAYILPAEDGANESRPLGKTWSSGPPSSPWANDSLLTHRTLRQSTEDLWRN